MVNTHYAKVITPTDLKAIPRLTPRSLTHAAGVLKEKKINGLKYQKILRKEWEKRLKKLIRK